MSYGSSQKKKEKEKERKSQEPWTCGIAAAKPQPDCGVAPPAYLEVLQQFGLQDCRFSPAQMPVNLGILLLLFVFCFVWIHHFIIML